MSDPFLALLAQSSGVPTQNHTMCLDSVLKVFGTDGFRCFLGLLAVEQRAKGRRHGARKERVQEDDGW